MLKYIISINLFSELLISLLITLNAHSTDYKFEEFLKKFEWRGIQASLSGSIDSMTIIKDNSAFRLGRGNMAILDFDIDRPLVMIFDGKGTFNYSPPDKIEQNYLNSVSGKGNISVSFDEIVFYFASDIADLVDTSGFERKRISKGNWQIFKNSNDQIREHLNRNIQFRLLENLINRTYGYYFVAFFECEEFGKIVFCIDPKSDDLYRVLRLTESNRIKSFKVLSGYSPEEHIRSLQKINNPIDIFYYDITGKIDENGKIEATCKITFYPLNNYTKYLYFKWSSRNSIKSAFDKFGNSLPVVTMADEGGFGVFFQNALEMGKADSITFYYKGDPFIKEWNACYYDDSNSWYPQNVSIDRSNYKLKFSYPLNKCIITNAQVINHEKTDDANISVWQTDYPDVQLYLTMGQFLSIENMSSLLIDYKMYIPITSSWGTDDYFGKFDLFSISFNYSIKADSLSYENTKIRQLLASYKNGRDIDVYKTLFTCIPFDTLNFIEVPFKGRKGALGLAELSTEGKAFIRIADEVVRAHELAHQWWGNIVSVNNYRDEWIIEGLAEYSAMFAYMNPIKVENRSENQMAQKWYNGVFTSGTVDLPVTYGSRAYKNYSSLYYNKIISKGAYIFHMMRYLLWDEENRDAPFIEFLRNLLDKYKWNTISTAKLKLLFDKSAGYDSQWFFDQWVYGTEIPGYRFEYSVDSLSDNNFQVVCRVKQEYVSDGFKMQIPISLIMPNDNKKTIKIWVDQPDNEIMLPPLTSMPKEIIFNTNDAVLCRKYSKIGME